jgi:hypothetical protein
LPFFSPEGGAAVGVITNGLNKTTLKHKFQLSPFLFGIWDLSFLEFAVFPDLIIPVEE